MSKNALITGANRGIGLSLSKLLQENGYSVFAACRTSSPELEKLNVNIIENIDVSEHSCAERLKSSLQGTQLNLLVNNAGILQNEVLGDLNQQSIADQFQTNALGPLRVTETVLDNLVDRSKIIMITSRMGSIEDNTSGGRYGYRMSKAALNIASVSLAHDLKHRNIAIGIVHPGLVGTDMIGGIGNITPDEAAALIKQRIDQLNINNSGTFWHSNGDKLPW